MLTDIFHCEPIPLICPAEHLSVEIGEDTPLRLKHIITDFLNVLIQAYKQANTGECTPHVIRCSGWWFGLCYLMTPGLSKDIQCPVWPHFFQTCKLPGQTAGPTLSGPSAWWLHIVTFIFLRGLCGYVWVNILTVSPTKGDALAETCIHHNLLKCFNSRNLLQLNYLIWKYGWMDERCFRPLLCTVKAELGRGQPGLMMIWK